MLGDLAAWWTLHHSQYTVKHFTRLPIWKAFEEAEEGYERNEQGRLEVMVGDKDDRVLTWEWGREREVMRKDKDTWIYQRIFREADSLVTISANMNTQDEEWGEVEISLSSEAKSYERWRVSNTSREYDRFSIRGFSKRGVKSGEKVHFSGSLETWNETYSEAPMESHIERVWERGDLKGCEKSHQEKDFSYGETRVTSPYFNETKSWQKDTQRFWGVIQGTAEEKTWSERWDISSALHIEERSMQIQGRKSGMKYERKGTDWKRMEWDGLEIASADTKAQPVETSQHLEEIKALALTEVLSSEEVLRKMLTTVPKPFSLDSEFVFEEKHRINASSGTDLGSLIKQIRGLFALMAKHESLKLQMMQETVSTQLSGNTELERLSKASQETLDLLQAERQEPVGKEGLIEYLMKLEKIKCEHIRKHTAQQKAAEGSLLPSDLAPLLDLQDSINTRLTNLLPSPLSLPSPAFSASPLSSLKCKQAQTVALLQHLEQIRSDDDWEGFQEEGTDLGLAEIRTKLASIAKPLEDTHPELVQEVAALDRKSLTPQKLLSVVGLLTAAVESRKSVQPNAMVGLISLMKRPSAVQEEVEYEETEEVVEVVEEEEDIQVMVQQMEVIHTKLQLQDDQITGLKQQLINKDRITQALHEELADLKRSAAVFEAREEELATAKMTLKQTQITLSDKVLEVQHLQGVCAKYEADTKRLKAAEDKLTALERENATLQTRLEALLHASRPPSEASAQMTALRDANKAAEIRIKEQQENLEKLTAERKTILAKRNKQLMLRLVSTISTKLTTERTRVFLGWKVISEAPISDWDYREMRKRPSFAPVWLSDSEVTNRLAAETYATLRKACTHTNTLMSRLDHGDICTNLLMDISDMYEFLEMTIEGKKSEDTVALEQGKQPLAVPEYILTVVLKKHDGNKHLADDFISRLLSTLYAQFRLAAPMAVIFSRLLGLFHSYPVLPSFAILLIRFNSRFNILASANPVPQPRNMPVLCGKALPLSILLSSFIEEFSVDSYSFKYFLIGLQPSQVSAGDYFCEVIKCFAKREKTTETIYLWKCFGSKESVALDDFEGAAERLGLPQSLLRSAFTDLSDKGVMTKTAFAAKMKSRSDTVIPVNKSEFLSAVLWACEASLRRVLEELAGKNRSMTEQTYNEDLFARTLQGVSTEVSEESARQLFAIAVKWSEDSKVTTQHILAIAGLLDSGYSSPFRFAPMPLLSPAVNAKTTPPPRPRIVPKLQSSRSTQ